MNFNIPMLSLVDCSEPQFALLNKMFRISYDYQTIKKYPDYGLKLLGFATFDRILYKHHDVITTSDFFNKQITISNDKRKFWHTSINPGIVYQHNLQKFENYNSSSYYFAKIDNNFLFLVSKRCLYLEAKCHFKISDLIRYKIAQVI